MKMDIRIKNYLGIALIIGVLMFAIAAWNYAQSFEPASYRSFVVSAEGDATAVPDIAEFNFGVITEGGIGKSINSLKDENVKKVNAMVAFLKEQDVDKKDIKTLSFDISPKYDNQPCYIGPCPAPEIVGYTVSQMVLVKVRDLDKAGDLLAGVVQKGANNVSGLTFTVDDPTKVENEAREEAFKKAREKAEMMADAGGFRLGKLISVEEGGNYIGKGRMMTAEMGGGLGGGGVVPDIEPGSEEVTITVVLRYEIK